MTFEYALPTLCSLLCCAHDVVTTLQVHQMSLALLCLVLFSSVLLTNTDCDQRQYLHATAFYYHTAHG